MINEKKNNQQNEITNKLSEEELAAVAAHFLTSDFPQQIGMQPVVQNALSAWQTAAWLGQLRGGC